MQSKTYKTTASLIQRSSIGLYVISLTQQCYCISNICGEHWSGISLVLLGAIGGIMSSAGLTWYANPAMWAAWSQIKKSPKKAGIFSLLGTIIAASFLLCTEIADTQPGVMMHITGYKPGYWLWLASMVVMLIGSITLYIWGRTGSTHVTPNETLRVDFNNRGHEGVKLITKGTLDEIESKNLQLYGGLEVIIWDEGFDDNNNPDNLAVEATVKYSDIDKCWVAVFDKDELKHESERKKPLLKI